MSYRNRLCLLASAGLAVVLGGCAGLPQDLVRLAESTPALVDAESRRIDNLEQQFGDFRDSDEFAAVAKYAEREGWGGSFAQARAKVKSAVAIYTVEILPLVEQDSPESADMLRSAVGKIAPLLAGAHDTARYWAARRDFLAEVAEQPDQVMRDCQTALSEIRGVHPELVDRATQAKRGHEARADDIDRLAQPLSDLLSATESAVAAAGAEHAKLAAGGDGDLAILGDSCQEARANQAEFLKGVPELGAKLAELDRSYSRTLMDMRADYALVVRRQSWDDYRDYPALHDADYRVSSVSAPAFEHLAMIPGSLARSSRGFFGNDIALYSGVDRNHWDSLGLDPYQQWPGGDTHAEFWVEDAVASYFHKYLVQESGEISEPDWMEVSEDFFFANVDNLGMDVEAKAYGSFEAEKLAHAAPPGMAYVGNSRYGRWAGDGSGGMIWAWGAPYLFYGSMFGSPMRYGRSEWGTWSGNYRGSRPYYGGTSTAPRWGSRSQTVRTSPRMQGSTFARGGGFRQPPSSVRGAGSLSRGGSFGASGK